MKVFIPVSDEDLDTWAPPSPDGRTLAVIQPKGVAGLLDVASGKVSPLATLERGDIPVQWTTDGKSLLVVRRKNARELLLTVVRLELATGKLIELYQLGPTDTVGISDLKNGVMTPDGKHYAYQAAQFIDELYVIDGLR